MRPHLLPGGVRRLHVRADLTGPGVTTGRSGRQPWQMEEPTSMSGSHNHAAPSHGRAFAVGIALNLGFVAVEATFGVISGSLALLADAGHNLSDVLGLVLAWGASLLARRKPTERHTYGLRSSSILAALLNALASIQLTHAGPLNLNASHARLAQMLGVSRQVVGKSLEALEQRGLVRRAYGMIELLDLPGLRGFVGRAPE